MLSFICFPVLSPKGKYDDEIEVYKHHLEQTYKLCRPCQAAVEYYIKHQNRQLRALLLSHHFKRRDSDKAFAQVRGGRWAADGGEWSMGPCQMYSPRIGWGRRRVSALGAVMGWGFKPWSARAGGETSLLAQAGHGSSMWS